jgi:hypothetical protein
MMCSTAEKDLNGYDYFPYARIFTNDLNNTGSISIAMLSSKQLKGRPCGSRNVKETLPAKKLFNAKRSRRSCMEMLQTNFTDNDFFITLTYNGELTYEERCKMLERFINRLQKQCDILRYLYVKEYGESGNFHQHIVIGKDCGLDRDTILAIWDKDKINRANPNWNNLNFDYIRTNGNGDLFAYMSKQLPDNRDPNYRHWGCSRNLKRPTIIKDYGTLSNSDVKNLEKAVTNDDRNDIENILKKILKANGLSGYKLMFGIMPFQCWKNPETGGLVFNAKITAHDTSKMTADEQELFLAHNKPITNNETYDVDSVLEPHSDIPYADELQPWDGGNNVTTALVDVTADSPEPALDVGAGELATEPVHPVSESDTVEYEQLSFFECEFWYQYSSFREGTRFRAFNLFKKAEIATVEKSEPAQPVITKCRQATFFDDDTDYQNSGYDFANEFDYIV